MEAPTSAEAAPSPAPAHTQSIPLPAPAPPAHAPRDRFARPRRAHRVPITECLNCNAQVTGRYCQACGQETHDQSVALGTLATELASEVASFDSKLARTALPLLSRPGFLTNEFNRGRRVRYLSPLKMYLVISALFFFVLAQQNAVKRMNLITVDPGAAVSSAQKDVLTQEAQAMNKSVAEAKTAQDKAQLLAAQAKIQKALNRFSPATPRAQPAKGLKVSLGPNNVDVDTLPKTVALYDAQQRALPFARRDSRVKHTLLRQLIKSRQNQQGLVQGFLDDLPRMMFVLLPAFALLLRATYWRTKRLYVSHLIFALHTHAFVFLLLTGVLLLPSATQGPAAGIALLLTTAYLYAALKVVYGQGWGRTLLAFGWLGFNYLFLLMFAFLLTLGAAFLLA